MKYDLKSYKQYCDVAVDLLGVTGEKAPLATRILRKGLPVIN